LIRQNEIDFEEYLTEDASVILVPMGSAAESAGQPQTLPGRKALR